MSLSPLLLTSVVLLIAAWLLATSPAAMAHNADSILGVFVSLDAWSLFYWGQDRFGMLLPLLAMPVRDAFANLLVQNVLSIFLFLAGTAAACARLRTPRPTLIALVVVLLVLVASGPFTFFRLFTTNQSYAPAIGLFGLAFAVCRTRTFAWPGLPAIGLMLLGAWTNGGVALAVVVLALIHAALVPATRAVSLPMSAGAILSVIGHRILQTFATVRLTEAQLPLPADMPALLWNFWRDAATLVVTPPMLVLLLVLWTLAIAAVIFARPDIQADTRADAQANPQAGTQTNAAVDRRIWWGSLAAVAFAAAIYGSGMALFLGGLDRHILAVLPLLVVTPIVILSRAQPAIHARLASRLAFAGVTIWLLLMTGVHTPAALHRDLLTRLGRGHAVQLYTMGVRAVTGDYWDVLPFTFATNMIYEQQGRGRPVLPIALRTEPLADRYAAVLRPDAIVAIVPVGHLQYWLGQPSLRALRLRTAAEYHDYAIAAVMPPD